MSKHILILADYYLPHYGGIEICVEQHILCALAHGYRVSLLTCHHDKTLPSQEDIQTPHGTYIIYRTGQSRWSYFWSGKSFLKTLLSTEHIDLIHCHTYVAGLLGAWCKKRFSTQTLFTVHEVFDVLRYRIKPRRSAWLYRAIETYIVTRTHDHIHTPSHYTKHILITKYAIDPKIITVVWHDIDPSRSPNNIDTEAIDHRKNTLGHDRYIILYYGHAGASKGLPTLLDALDSILPRSSDILFVANITSSRNQKSIIDRIKKHFPNTSYHIEQGMTRTMLQGLVMCADLVVVPSLSEGFGFVGAEVSLMQKKAIISRSGSLPEIVSGDIHFFEPENSDELTHHIINAHKHNITTHITSDYQPSGNIDLLAQLYNTITGSL